MTSRTRLAELMEERRLDLRQTWREIAIAAGTTTETIRQARFGNARIQKLTKRGLEDALQWARGSIDAFLEHGQDPHPLPPVDAGVIDRAALRDLDGEQLVDMMLSDPETPEVVRTALAGAVARALSRREATAGGGAVGAAS